ncbi:MAG: FixH family protein, partial [Bacteroidales bacterium]|nr:FixH family protein [Bacteroidales bacterium]
MKIKINWGTGILIFLVIFFIAIFSFVYFSFQLQINLVEDDYYPKEIT